MRGTTELLRTKQGDSGANETFKLAKRADRKLKLVKHDGPN